MLRQLDLGIEPWTPLSLEEISACSGSTVCLDTETTGLLWYKDRLIGVGIYCPLRGVAGYYPTWEPERREAVVEAIRSWGPGTVAVGHNFKFDAHFLGLDTLYSGWQLVDTTVLVHLCDSRLPKSLESAARTFLGVEAKKPYRDRGQNKPVWEWPEALRAEYCLADCKNTYELARELIPKVKALGSWPLFTQQMRYLSIVWRIERHGILYDRGASAATRAELLTSQHELEQELYAKVGHEFNWRSPAQLSKALYADFGWERPKNPFLDEHGVDMGRAQFKKQYTAPATSAFLLVGKSEHPLGELVVSIREHQLLGDRLEEYEELSQYTGRIHTSFNLTGTRTGRLSSSNPNMQNLAGEIRAGRFGQDFGSQASLTRGELLNIKRLFHVIPGRLICDFDYKQMEIRIFGFLARDGNMLEALARGSDIHADISEKVWGHREDPWRDRAKTLSFGQTRVRKAELKPSQLLEAPRGNQQPGWLGTATNGSETDSAIRPVAAAAA